MTPTKTPTATTTPGIPPVITGGNEIGSTMVFGRGDPSCTPSVVRIFDCGPEQPPVCNDGNDTQIGTGSKDAQGNFIITVPMLVAGQKIYATDTCDGLVLVGPAVTVGPRNAAPASSTGTLAAIAVLLSMFGLWRVIQRREA